MPSIFYDLKVGDWLGLEGTIRPRREQNIFVFKLHCMIQCRYDNLIDFQSVSKSIL